MDNNLDSLGNFYLTLNTEEHFFMGNVDSLGNFQRTADEATSHHRHPRISCSMV